MTTFRRLLVSLLVLAGCAPPAEIRPQPHELAPLPALSASAAGSGARIGGSIGARAAQSQPIFAPGVSASEPAGATASGVGDITLDFADTDIREVVTQILGRILAVNYIIDPGVRGAITLRTSKPLSRAQLLPVLQALLAENGATLTQTDGMYRVMTAAPGTAGVTAAGSVVVKLHYAGAEQLARILQPFAGTGGRIVAEPGQNAVIIASDADTRDALVAMVRAFDTDTLAGQSYALFPVGTGGVRDFAAALQDALASNRTGSGEAGRSAVGSPVRVVPMDRISAVLVIASQPRVLDEARRVYDLLEKVRRQTIRNWQVSYLQNSDANDIGYVLQSAFTPNNVTAQPRSPASSFSNGPSGSSGGMSRGGAGLGGGTAGQPGASALAAGGVTATSAPQVGAPQVGATSAPAAGNPLLGGLDPTGGGNSTLLDGMRIIPNEQSSALLVYGTAQEHDAVAAMLRKLDIIPRQVRIDATIAEVTLNDDLQYGTQFYFRSGGINGALSSGNQQIANPQQIALNSQFPGFFLGGRGLGGAPFAINALQAITTVKVLSSPQLLVLDNQQARLQVGNLVPYLAQTSQSTISPGAPVINSINYQQTGVIMQIRPRINTGGLVTLDISQEVSDVSSEGQVAGINSPTFLERTVSSRVVVQDGQTIGLAGLIRDSSSTANDGLPWLKDVPLLGLLAGRQNNVRARTELLILITPHVIQDQREARALTEDLREQLGNAAAVPGQLTVIVPSGSSDPSAKLRSDVRKKLAPAP